ncbi:hypothetical protein ACWDYH_27560 [Nocardia goodfellowii]|uniref:Uncharacterized protein n=1 Tax=Nocardia goodfellowii TaxID=882446 RepID=A0ABS4QRT7_9NOCA|nr:hypothetical protein [Nocardia goodfellowii]MBP2194415.1 hypothetical protein [Nocardia goodfellowii]
MIDNTYSDAGDTADPQQHPTGNRMWTVSAVVVRDEDSRPWSGVVAAAHLGDAAEQLCEYLPEPKGEGDYYLVAQQVPLIGRGQRAAAMPRPTWVSPISRDDDTGAKTYGRWIVADQLPGFRKPGQRSAS